MFIEERCYTSAPGRAHDHFDLYAAKGMAIQLRYLPLMLGYYVSEIGDLNDVVHLWGHKTLDARDDARCRMKQDPAFQAYWQKVRTLAVRQKTRIMKQEPFFVPGHARFVDACTPPDEGR